MVGDLRGPSYPLPSPSPKERPKVKKKPNSNSVNQISELAQCVWLTEGRSYNKNLQKHFAVDCEILFDIHKCQLRIFLSS